MDSEHSLNRRVALRDTSGAIDGLARPASPSEEDRVAALRSYGILDTPREAEFDDVVQMASQACGTPIAVLSLIDRDRQWFKAEIGLGVRQVPLEAALGVAALREPDILLVPDTTADPRFAHSLLVDGTPHIGFYAGVPLRTPAGLAIGVLSVADLQPRDLGEQQSFILSALARAVMALLEQRKAIVARDEALLKAARTEKRSQQILNSAIDYAIISFNFEGRVTSWNEGARRILGWTEEEMLGEPADRIFTPEDVAANRPAIEMGDALRTGRGNDERWHIRADGSRFFAFGEMMALRDEGGTATGFIKILRDRTEDRRATRALRDSQARIDIALGTGLVGFLDWEVATGVVHGDSCCAALYGVDEDRLAEGMTAEEMMELIHPGDREKAAEIVEQVLAGKGDYAKQIRVIHREGLRHLLVRGRCYEYDGNGPQLFTAVVVDVTASQAAEAAALESESRYRNLFNSLDQGFCVVEMLFDGDTAIDYRFLEVNGAFERLTGLTDAEGRTMRSLVPHHEEHWFEIYGRVARKRAPERFENPAASLADRWYDVYAFPVDAPEQNRVAILFNDVTNSRRAQEVLTRSRSELEELVADRTADLARTLDALRQETAERAQAEEALRQSQKMEAVGQLTGGLAHDFNNLLTGITGSLELLQTRISQNRIEEAGRYITAAQGAAKRAAALTHRLLAFSRRQTLDPKPTDVNRLIAGMEELVRRTVGPEIAIHTVSAAPLWNTLVDPSQLESALLNLCINARDAMPEGGRITIETTNQWIDARGARELELKVGPYVCLCVTDTGTGMPPEVIAKAFEPFFTTKPIGMGTGLGLSMIYGFARQSGGQVRIHSEVGEGTTVHLYLPRHLGAEDAVADAPQLADAPRARHGETVLVVDDEPTVRMLVSEVLADLGYTAIEANDAATAMRFLESDLHIDLLVTDVGLSGGANGRQVADAARLSRPDLNVLFITGYAENAALSDGHLGQGMHVLTKPFALETLASRIQELIDDRRP